MMQEDIMQTINENSNFGNLSKIIIDAFTNTGSAFGATESGDQVFVKASLIERCHASEGDICTALLIQNYEDKRLKTPWRAVRLCDA